MKKTIFLVLSGLFLLSFFLRFYLLPQNLFFGPEQGIDFLVIKNIAINHKLTLIGAKTDISGIFHGPVYYYLATIPFLISKGSPLAILSFFILIDCSIIFLIYLLGKQLFNQRVGIISAILFCVSFEVIDYARWLSSHPLALLFSVLYIYFMNSFLQNNKKSLFLAVIFYGLLGQAEFLDFIFFAVITILIILLNFKQFKKQNIRTLTTALVLMGLFSAGNFFLFDIRHQFLISKNILLLLTGKSGYHTNWFIAGNETLSTFIDVITNTITPFSKILAIIVLLTGLFILGKESIKNKKNYQLILIWLITPMVVLIILKHQVLEQFFVCSVIAMILTVSIVIDKIYSMNKYLGIAVATLIIGLNLYTWVTNIPQNHHILFQSTQPDLKYSDEKKVIDKVYQEAHGKPFSIQSYTIPYWSQQGWEYLFWQYGKQKYGYEPIPEKARILFVIVQDDPSDKPFQNNWLKNTVPTWGREVKSFQYGIITLKELKVEKL